MDNAVLPKEQVTEMGGTISKLLRDDLGKTIQDILPEVMKYHGVDLAALRQPLTRLPMAEEAAKAGSKSRSKDGFGTFGEYLLEIHPTLNRGQIDARLKATSEGEGGLGGFLVPTQFVANLMMVALEESIVRSRAFILPMASDTARIPAVRDTSHATSVFGGVQMYWSAESGSLTESNPTFRTVGLTAKKLHGYTTVTNELLLDSAIGLEALLTEMFGKAIIFFEDVAFISGTGAGQPLGLLNAPGVVSVAKETGQAASTIVAENLDKMYSRMLPSSLNRAIWIAHNDCFPQLAAMARNVGTGGSAVWVSNMVGGPPSSIYGRPVIYTEKCASVGTTGDIYFVDWSYYILAQRLGVTMAASPHVRFTNDETVFRFVERLDGQPWVDSPITPRNGTNTLSPYVKLDARA